MVKKALKALHKDVGNATEVQSMFLLLRAFRAKVDFCCSRGSFRVLSPSYLSWRLRNSVNREASLLIFSFELRSRSRLVSRDGCSSSSGRHALQKVDKPVLRWIH